MTNIDDETRQIVAKEASEWLTDHLDGQLTVGEWWALLADSGWGFPTWPAAWNGRGVDLTLTEFWLVHALARHPGHVKNREQLMAEAHIVVDDSTITSHIKRMRRKFVAVDAAFDRIDTVYGMGYRWKAET